jgi:hypothetical protein
MERLMRMLKGLTACVALVSAFVLTTLTTYREHQRLDQTGGRQRLLSLCDRPLHQPARARWTR